MAWKPNHTRNIRADRIKLHDIIANGLHSSWLSIDSIDTDRRNGRVEMFGYVVEDVAPDGTVTTSNSRGMLRMGLNEWRVIGW